MTENKAHTATANRIAQRLGTRYNPGPGFDIQTDELTIEVETTATVHEGIERLREKPGKVYVALTNKDGVREALRIASGTRVGVMDPQGTIIRESIIPGP
jgi:hypothetical protein